MEDNSSLNTDATTTGKDGVDGTLSLAAEVSGRYNHFPPQRSRFLRGEVIRLHGMAEGAGSLALEIMGRWSRGETPAAGELPYQAGIRCAGIKGEGDGGHLQGGEKNPLSSLPASAAALHGKGSSLQGREAWVQATGDIGDKSTNDDAVEPRSVNHPGKAVSVRPLRSSLSSIGSIAGAESGALHRHAAAVISPMSIAPSAYCFRSLPVVATKVETGRQRAKPGGTGITVETGRSATDKGLTAMEDVDSLPLMHPAKSADLQLALYAGEPVGVAGDQHEGSVHLAPSHKGLQPAAEEVEYTVPAVTLADHTGEISHDRFASISALSFGKNRPYLLSRLPTVKDSGRDGGSLSPDANGRRAAFAAPPFAAREEVEEAGLNRTPHTSLPLHRDVVSASTTKGMTRPPGNAESITIAPPVRGDSAIGEMALPLRREMLKPENGMSGSPVESGVATYNATALPASVEMPLARAAPPGTSLRCDMGYPLAVDCDHAGSFMPVQRVGEEGALHHAASTGSSTTMESPGAAASAPTPGEGAEGPDLERLAERVYSIIEQRLTIEKERRGL